MSFSDHICGKERDAESGLDYFGARYFSGPQGRFTSPDEPLSDQFEEDPQSWNLYAYTRNNPLRFTDPTGRACRVNSNGGEYDDNSGGQSCAEVHEADKNIKPSAIVTADLPPAETENTSSAISLFVGAFTNNQLPGYYERRADYNRQQGNYLAYALDKIGANIFPRNYLGPEGILFVGSMFSGGSGSALKVTFGHGARHLTSGLSQQVVEAAIRADVAEAVKGASATGEFWGKVTVQGKEIIYRAYTLGKDLINIGTYYPR